MRTRALGCACNMRAPTRRSSNTFQELIMQIAVINQWAHAGVGGVLPSCCHATVEHKHTHRTTSSLTRQEHNYLFRCAEFGVPFHLSTTPPPRRRFSCFSSSTLRTRSCSLWHSGMLKTVFQYLIFALKPLRAVTLVRNMHQCDTCALIKGLSSPVTWSQSAMRRAPYECVGFPLLTDDCVTD